jgi:hypothetical protein
MEYKVTLTAVEDKALSHVTYDPQDWIQSAISERCRLAIEEIAEKEFERITSQGGEISGTKEDIVLAAQIKSGKEIQDEIESKLTENLLPSN